jgi:hypothetical protein
LGVSPGPIARPEIVLPRPPDQTNAKRNVEFEQFMEPGYRVTRIDHFDDNGHLVI